MFDSNFKNFSCTNVEKVLQYWIVCFTKNYQNKGTGSFAFIYSATLLQGCNIDFLTKLFIHVYVICIQ